MDGERPVLRQRVPVNGVELAWDSWGDRPGPPLVLSHGYTGSSHDFALHVDALSRRRRVVALDHRGHGMSTKTGTLRGYSIGQITQDLEAFLDEVIGQPLDLLGHSMGGLVALGVVLGRPDLVRSLVLMDTSAWSFRPDDPGLRAMLADFIVGYDPTQGLPAVSSDGPEAALIDQSAPEWWRARKLELSRGLDPYAVKALGVRLFSDDFVSLRPRLPTIRCPVTVVVGSEDHPFADQAPALAAELGNGHLAVVDGAFHSPQLTHPGDWQAVIEGHLDRVERG